MKLGAWAVMMAAAVGLSATGWSAGNQIGVGANYWKAVDDIDLGNVDEDGISWVLTYQYKPGMVGLGLDLDWKEKGFGGSEETVYEPQAYLILGQTLYAAAGIGGYYSDGNFADDPFYLLRAGLDLRLLKALHLDLYATYRFESLDDLDSGDKGIDTDTVMLGAAARFEF
jgi:hypothetical protein